MFRLSLYPVFDSYLLVAVAALLLVGLMWFGPSREKTGRRHRAMLALLRAAVIALVVLAMLRPTLIYTQTKKQAATLVVLADQSRSMSVPDAVGNKTRWEALRDALADAAPALGQAATRLRAEGLHLRRRRARSRRRGRQDRAARQARGTADRHRRGAGGRAAPRGGQAAAGRGAAERRRAAGLRPARSAAANRRRPAETPRLSAVHLPASASRAGWARPRTWPSRT